MMNFATCVFIVVFAVCNVNGFHHNQCTAPYSPHPNDCTKFYQCDQGRLVLKSCGPGTHWNARLLTCDWPANAQCQSGGGYPSQPGYPNYPGYPTNQPGNYPSNGNNGPIQFPPNQPSYPGTYPPNGNYPSNNRPIQFPPNQQTYPGQQPYPGNQQRPPFNPTPSGNPYPGQGQNWNGQSTPSNPGQNNYNGGYGK